MPVMNGVSRENFKLRKFLLVKTTTPDEIMKIL